MADASILVLPSAMRSSKVETQRRVSEVLNLRLLGAEFADIRAHAEKEGWNVKSRRQLFRYIRAGDKLLAKTLDKDRECLINRHIAARRALYARAVAASDYGTAARLLADEARLLSLYPESKTLPGHRRGGPTLVLNIEEVIVRSPDAQGQETPPIEKNDVAPCTTSFSPSSRAVGMLPAPEEQNGHH